MQRTEARRKNLDMHTQEQHSMADIGTNDTLDVFLNPGSVAVIGATERTGSWGSFLLEGLFAYDYPGRVYAVNHRGSKVYDLPVFKDVRDIPGPVDLAILTIPELSVEEAVMACGQKGIRGAVIVTAGFGEAEDGDPERERALSGLARSFGMRLLGPNVSGTFNLHDRYNGSSSPIGHLRTGPLAAACQGGYAFQDLLASGYHRGLGVGKFIHTGNECDLTVTDFLEHFGRDPDVQGILMYVETIRDGRRFVDVAREVTRKKPVVVYKAGRTPGSARAAQSHTAALAGTKEVYDGMFHQVGIIVSPSMEVLLLLGHALVERAPMAGNRVGIVTMGGSWGVALADALEEAGLLVPELSRALQRRLRGVGIPMRASTKNPVDIGASGRWNEIDVILTIGREIITSGEVDALIMHGMGRPGGMNEDKKPTSQEAFLEFEKDIIVGFSALERETGVPVLIGSHYSPWESRAVCDVNRLGVMVYNDLHQIAQILSGMVRQYRVMRGI